MGRVTLGVTLRVIGAAPDSRVSASVKHSRNDDVPRFRAKVDAIRKPLRGDAAHAVVNHSIELGPAGSERNASHRSNSGPRPGRCASYQAAASMNSALAARWNVTGSVTA